MTTSCSPYQRGGIIFDAPKYVPAIGVGHDVLWSEGEPLIIAGPPGVGKTTIAQQLALRPRRGRSRRRLRLPGHADTRWTLSSPPTAEAGAPLVPADGLAGSPFAVDAMLVIWTCPSNALLIASGSSPSSATKGSGR